MRTLASTISAALSVISVLATTAPTLAQDAKPPYSSIAPQPAGPPAKGTLFDSVAPIQPTLKAGDLVRPLSGGPVMTVREVKGNEVICGWHVMGAAHKATFPVSQLSLVGGPSYQQRPAAEPQPYRPCPANVITRSGRHECLG